MRPQDPLFRFFIAFYVTNMGRIFVLASPRNPVRDGLATAQMCRLFSLPEFDGISVEPVRRNIQPAENVIFIGSTPPYSTSSVQPLLPNEVVLGERLEKIDDESCYRFVLVDGRSRVLQNTVTGELYVPEGLDRKERDFGIIRRVNRIPTEFTVTVGGVHPLGTLGCAKCVTSAHHLEVIWRAIDQLEGFDESLPLEILVESTFEPLRDDGLHTLASVQVAPLKIVYNRRWAFDLLRERRWVDQLPWDVCLRVTRDETPRDLSTAPSSSPVPRLEISMDLHDLDPRRRAICEKLLRDPAKALPRRRTVSRVLEWLTAESDRFTLELLYKPKVGDQLRTVKLPKGQSKIRRIRKRFLVHLALCRLFGTSFRCDASSIRRFFPKFELDSDDASLPVKFISNVVGKMRSGGFERLLGESGDPTDFVQIEQRRRSYELRADLAVLDAKIRF